MDALREECERLGCIGTDNALCIASERGLDDRTERFAGPYWFEAGETAEVRWLAWDESLRMEGFPATCMRLTGR